MRRLVSISVAGLFLFIISVGVVYAGPTAISPSSDTVAVVPTGCTTFSWSEVSGAVSYRLEVYEAVTSNILSHKDAMAIGAPLLVGDIDAPGFSWTPTVDRCLSEGKVYVWYVGARDSEGNLTWSEGKAFEVRALSEAAMQEAVRDTVKEYLKTEWKNTDSFSQFKEEIKKEVTKGIETEGNKRIMGNEGDGNINTYYGTWAGASLPGTAYYNAFFGYGAGYSNNAGDANTFMGTFAGSSNTTGNSNTFMGYEAGFSNTTGSGNVFLGSSAGANETGSNKLYIDNSDTSTPLIWGDFATDIININGKLGIGTIAPNQKIDLAGGAITVNGSDISAGTGPGQQRPMFGWTENGRIIMGYGGTGGGNLELYSRGHASRPGEFYFVYGGAAGTGKVKFAHYNGSSWNTRMTVLASGYVGLGTETPSYPIHHSSGAYLSTGGVWTNASSREYKENIEPLSADKAIEALKGLNPVTYTYRAAPDERHVGFIAEDVPELVATKDRKSLSPMDIVAVLTRVTKEQQSEIERLKGVIQKLEAQNKKLEAENQATREEFKDKIAYIERLLLFQNSIAASK